MSTEKPSRPEDEFIRREEAEELAKKKVADEREATTQAREDAQKLHFMKCPKCGGDLAIEISHAIEIDRCKDCAGVWLDAGELEKLAGEDSNVLQDMVSFFRKVGEAKPISDM